MAGALIDGAGRLVGAVGGALDAVGDFSGSTGDAIETLFDGIADGIKAFFNGTRLPLHPCEVLLRVA